MFTQVDIDIDTFLLEQSIELALHSSKSFYHRLTQFKWRRIWFRILPQYEAEIYVEHLTLIIDQ